MWEIFYHKHAVKRIRKLPPQIREKLNVWVEIAILEGPNGLRAFPGFNDEALSGDWKGFRSSRLSLHYGVIYSSDKDELRILIVDITPLDSKRS